MNLRLEHFEKIADGLAENGYGVVDNFLTLAEVIGILRQEQLMGGLSNMKRAGIGKQTDRRINEQIRGDYIQWIDETKAGVDLRIYLTRLRELLSFVNQNLLLSLKDIEVHFAVYPPGSFYLRHLDQFRGDGHRKLSVICYLNEGWEKKDGGQLRMHLPDGPVDFFPIAGRLVCFRSDQIEHEVLPATRDRLSITGWILDQLLELRHLDGQQ